MNIKVLLILVIAMFSVSISPIIVRLLDISPISMAFWRMFIGGGLLWIVSLFFKQKPLSKSNRIKTIISGFLLGFHFYFFFSAVKMTNIANATFLGTMAPLFTMLIEIFWLKRKISINIIICIIIILLGSLVMVMHDFDFSKDYTSGNIYAMICSLLLGIGFVISENVRKNESTISFSRTLYISAAVTLFILSVLIDKSVFNISINEWNITGLLILGIVPTIFGHNSLYYAIKYISPTVVASVPLGEPIIASIIAFFMFNELISVQIFISSFIILSGLFYLINITSTEKQIYKK